MNSDMESMLRSQQLGLIKQVYKPKCTFIIVIFLHTLAVLGGEAYLQPYIDFDFKMFAYLAFQIMFYQIKPTAHKAMVNYTLLIHLLLHVSRVLHAVQTSIPLSQVIYFLHHSSLHL